MPTNYNNIDFLTEKGVPMTIEAKGVRPINDTEDIRYKDEARIIHGNTIYEIAKTWADDNTSYLKVWLLKLRELHDDEGSRPPKHEDDKW